MTPRRVGDRIDRKPVPGRRAPSRSPTGPHLTRLMTLRVDTLFFAAYRDLLGTDRLEVGLEPGSTVQDLVRSLRLRGEPFSALPVRPAVAVNLTYAAPDQPLADGDEVAFIPPVAGG